MYAKTEVLHPERLVRFEVSGQADTTEMLAALDEGVRLMGDARGYDIFSDLRQAAAVTPQQVRTLLSHMAQGGNVFKGGRCAVVVADEASYGMMRLMTVHASKLDIAVGVFWTKEEALLFLQRADRELPSELP